MITSRKNPLILMLQNLACKPQEDLAVAEGFHLVTELMLCRQTVSKIIYTPVAAENFEGRDIVRKAFDAGVELVEVSDDCYGKFSQLKSPEGIAAVFVPVSFSADKIFTRTARLAVADGVQDPGNAGAICRVAEAAGMTGCIFIGGVNPLGGKFLRASMGSCFRLPCIRMDADVFCEACRENSVNLFAADGGEGAVDYNKVNYASPVAVVLGSEGSGVSEQVRQAATSLIRIPMLGRVESLNVSVAAGIIFYHSGFQQ